jgi:glycosyltransferase involved in cell wall biosynthesis
LVHPAPLEGFGLTLLEAMAAGTPVVAVRSASSEEVCGDAALLMEPGELRDALIRVTGDAELRERLAQAGRGRAAEFSWERSAERHLEAYRLAVAR